MYEFYSYKNIKLKSETPEELSLTEFRRSWHWISKYQVLSESLMKTYKNRIEWINISKYQAFSESFIKKSLYKFWIPWICQLPRPQGAGVSSHKRYEYQNLSLKFLIKHQDKINLNCLKRNDKISQETKDKFRELITNKNI